MDLEKWDRPLTIIILIGIIVLAFIFVFNYYQSGNYSNTTVVHNTSQDNVSLDDFITPNISATVINMSNSTQKDKQFITVLKESENILRKDIKGAIDASNKNDPNAFQNSGKKIEQDSSKYLESSNGIKISSQYGIILSEYRKGLQKFYRGGKYIQSGAISQSDLNISIEYINAGLNHFNNIDIILNNSNSKIEFNN